jgi:hypothetical protein
MAQELTLNLDYRFIKGGKDTGKETLLSNAKFDVAGNRDLDTVQEVGFAAKEAVQKAEVVATGAMLIVKNLDATNFVNLFTDGSSGTGITKIGPGQVAVLPAVHADAAVPALQADTAMCRCRIIWVEA